MTRRRRSGLTRGSGKGIRYKRSDPILLACRPSLRKMALIREDRRSLITYDAVICGAELVGKGEDVLNGC